MNKVDKVGISGLVKTSSSTLGICDKLAIQNKLNTKDRLVRWRMQVDEKCVVQY